jgi:carbon-monoxide dehydrogenase small subunit
VNDTCINGERVPIPAPALSGSLLDFLRDDLHLYGAKNACVQGECSSCVVIVDGVLLCACLTITAAVVDREVLTIEGMADADPITDRLRDAFVETGAVQCGFCTPGFVVAARHLLERCPNPSEDEICEALAGNLCRCTGYGRIIEAIRVAAKESG